MYIVTGSTGMLGRYVVEALTRAAIPFDIWDRSTFDLERPKAVDFENPEITGVVHLAAETDVDLCERDPARAYMKNYFATKVLVDACRERGLPIIFISTSNVFGLERRDSYCELDTPAPLNYYGKSKLMAEDCIRANLPLHTILRSGWMLGGGKGFDKKFVGKVVEQLESGKSEILAVSDKYGSLTYGSSLANAIVDAILKQNYGTFHFGSTTCCSRFEIAKYVVAHFKNSAKVLGVDSSLFPLSAPRPSFEAMRSICSPPSFAVHLSSWEYTLEQYLSEWSNRTGGGNEVF